MAHPRLPVRLPQGLCLVCLFYSFIVHPGIHIWVWSQNLFSQQSYAHVTGSPSIPMLSPYSLPLSDDIQGISIKRRK